MRTPVAWSQLTHRKARTAVALGGVAFAILLVFMQLGFYASCSASATMLQDMLDFDVVLVSPHYLAMWQAGSIPVRRLHQSRALDDVVQAVAVRAATVTWRSTDRGDRIGVLAIGFDPPDRPFRVTEIDTALARLSANDGALVDRVGHVLMGPRAPGDRVEVNGRELRIVGEYEWGAGFNSLGALLVNDATFQALSGVGAETCQLGLLRLADGSDVDEVARALDEVLPDDVQALTRSELQGIAEHFWLKMKPIGLMFTSGVLVALLVGTVILYQVLSADIANHLREYATLKAIGYHTRSIQAIVLQQGFLLAVLGFLPSAAAAHLMYKGLRESTNLPVEMTFERLVVVLLLSVGMCGLSGLLALRRVTSADPADLF